jgi:hypothetical protein
LAHAALETVTSATTMTSWVTRTINNFSLPCS